MARKRKINELEEILLKIPADRQYIGRKIVDELIFMNVCKGSSASRGKLRP